jgi:hypothetical protein
MKVTRLQAILSIMVVGFFLIVTAIVALTPVLGGYPTAPYSEHLKTFASLYSGIVGLVVGFFFGRRKSDSGG